MKPKHTHERGEGRRRTTGRALLRRRPVQMLLCVVAAAQVATVRAGVREAGDALPRLAPVVVSGVPAEGVGAIWTPRAVEREVGRLTSSYRSQGYRVPADLARNIAEAALEHGIDPRVAFGLVRAESSFRNTATSPVGAVGLTQLMPSTARWMEPGTTRRELRDPETNLRVGFKYLRYLIDKYEGNERLALLAYNRGPGTVDRALKRGRNPDNGYADYVYGRKDHGHRMFSDD